MKKILYILHYPPPVHGAAMVGQYIKESTLINSSFSSVYINLSTSTSVDEIGKNGWFKMKRFIDIIIQVFRAIKKDKPDLVYLTLTSTGIGFFKDAIVILFIKIFGLKLVYHFHNKGVNLNQHKWVYHFFYSIVFKKASVILLTPYLYNDIKKYVPESKVFYCANGVPELPYKEAEIRPITKVPEILFLSNLIESKGVSILLYACEILNSKNIPFRCSFIGGEGDISKVQFQGKVIELGLQNKVFYLGKKYGKDKHEAYKNADIFTLPTFYHNECFPLVLLEAMQYALPLISTPEGGIQAIVKDGETGFLVEQNSENELANKLEYLIMNPKFSYQMGLNARNYFLKEFTLETFEKNLVQILDKIN